MDPSQHLLAERRLVQALRRLHRREPLRADVRLDAVLDEARAVPAARSTGHRGSAPLLASDAALIGVVDELVAAGVVVRSGRRLRLAEHQPTLDPGMRERVDRLLDGLRAARADPPRADGIAARLGIPPDVIAQLRASGELVAVAPGIDYPRDVWEGLVERLDRIAGSGPLSVSRVRDELRTSRRHAEALLAWRRGRRAAKRAERSVRSRRPGG
jgi:hypothetical protein